MLREVKSPQRKMRELHATLTDASLNTDNGSGLGTAGVTEGGYDVTAMKDHTTAGLYTVHFNIAFARTPVITASALHATAKLFCVVVSKTTAQCVVQVFSDAGTATAATSIDVRAYGSDAAAQN